MTIIAFSGIIYSIKVNNAVQKRRTGGVSAPLNIREMRSLAENLVNLAAEKVAGKVDAVNGCHAK